MKYSKTYKVKNRTFRYNYDRNCIEWIDEMTDYMREDNAEWMRKHPSNTPLWDVTEDGYWLADSIGCFIEDWEEDPQGMCEYWSNDIDMEIEMTLPYI